MLHAEKRRADTLRICQEDLSRLQEFVAILCTQDQGVCAQLGDHFITLGRSPCEIPFCVNRTVGPSLYVSSKDDWAAQTLQFTHGRVGADIGVS